MSNRIILLSRAAFGALIIGSGWIAAASAQETQLPEITVTAPSPIRQRTSKPESNENNPSNQSAESSQPPNPWLPSFVATTFNSMILMTQSEIERTSGNTLGALLFEKPGISATTFAPAGASRPVIRGLDSFRVRVQENGIGTHDVADLGEDHGVPIDPLAARQIEVLRGPSTLRWGSQAIGGVVSVSNNRIPDSVPVNGFSMETKGAVSSVDRGYEAATILDMGSMNGAFGGAVHADIYRREGGDYAIPDGRQANSSFRSGGESLGASSIEQNGFFGFNVTHFASLYHIPGIDGASNNTRIDLDQLKFTSKGEYRPDAAGIDAVRYWFGATNYKHNEINDDDGIAATFKNQEQEIRVETQLSPRQTPFGALTTAFGIQGGHQQLGTSGEAGGLLAPAETTTIAGFVFHELKFTNTLKAQLAGRIEYAAVNGTPDIFPADFNPLTPGFMTGSETNRNFAPKSVSLGLLKDLPNNFVASLVGSYVERAPRTPELFSKGAHDAPGTFEIGNPDLKIEKAQTIEVGLRRPVGQARFDGSLYYTKFNNFIYKRLTGLQCNETFASCGVVAADPAGEIFKQIVYSQNDATFYGGEFAAQYDIGKLAHGTYGTDAQYDYVHAKFSDGTYVPRIPPQRAGGGLYWTDSEWFTRVGILHAWGHNEIAPNETSTGGYNLLKAEINYKQKIVAFGGFPAVLTVGVVGDNLLNDSVRNSVSFRKDDVELPGRNVRVYASLKF